MVYRESVDSSADSDLYLPFWLRTWFIALLLVMALSFFALAMYMLLALDSEHTSTPVSAASEGVQVGDFLFESIFCRRRRYLIVRVYSLSLVSDEEVY